MAAHQAPLSLGFSRQEHWSGLPRPSPMHESEKWKWSHSVVSDPQQPHGLQPSRILRPWDFPSKSTGVGCYCLLRCYLRMSEIPGIPLTRLTLPLKEPPCICSVDSLTSSLKGDAIIPTLQVWKLRLSETKISPGITWLENAVAGVLTQAVRPQDPAFVPRKNISQELIVQTSDVL